MRVFITGATGYIGSALVRELVRAGHEVTGLVRSAERGDALKSLGAAALLGRLDEPATYAAAAGQHDAVVHAAFDHGAGAAAVGIDWIAIDALFEVARASGERRSVVYTSGVWVLGNTGDCPADEDVPATRPPLVVAWRPAHERLVLTVPGDTVAGAVIRPGMVYGGRGGLVSRFFASAVNEGAAAYVGDGSNRWSLVHRDDLAVLYRLILEQRARGIFHGVDGVPTRTAELATAAAEAAGKGGATRSVPLEEARKEMGPVADALVLDQVVAGRRSAELGWTPRRRSFVESARAAYAEWRG